jgi:hypothetical protein
MSEIDKLIRKRQSLLKELGELEELIDGSFFAREVNGATRYCLSRMHDGRQRQTYVAARHAEAVRTGIKQYARALEILRELGDLNMKRIKEGLGGVNA